MYKYLNTCLLVLVLLIAGTLNIKGMGGPFPSPYASTTSSDNPTYRMSNQQRDAVNRAFANAQNAVRQNHSLCSSRGDCIKLDTTTLTSFVNSNPNHPARPYFEDILGRIRYDVPRQKFGTEWVIYQNLSAQRQQEFRDGLRIVPFQPQLVRAAWGSQYISTPAYYNKDDVLTSLLQEISQSHRNCYDYIGCVSSDQQIIGSFINKLAPGDPVRDALTRLSYTIDFLSKRKVFDTDLYLRLHNPLNPDWYDTFRKNRTKEFAGYGLTEWQNVIRYSRPTRWYSARVTNGTPSRQQPAQPQYNQQSYYGQPSYSHQPPYGQQPSYSQQAPTFQPAPSQKLQKDQDWFGRVQRIMKVW
ncbi:MAG: hypothetical protein FJX71_00040 [Alphaproteobacteria bacterium]|nr:hypothetical protein [Alphaproteobacteria bacterium]